MMPPILIVEIAPDRESVEPPAQPGSVIDVLARTLWGEARGGSVRGTEAVAAVVMNRAAKAGGAAVVAVCSQLPCWTETPCAAVTVADRPFRICLRIARRAVGGGLGDPTGGATHYHRIGQLPPWSKGHAPSAEIGDHLFYNDLE